MFRRTLLTGIAASLALAGPAFALDEVVRKSDGTSVRGKLTSATKIELTVEAAGQSTTVPATDVASVRWDGEPPQLNITRTREANGDLDFALKSYGELLAQVSPEQKDLRNDVQFLVARTQARLAVADPAKADAAVKSLNDYLAANADSFRYFESLEWLGRVQVAGGDYDGAKSTYAKLAASDLPEVKMASQNAVARIKLAQDDLDGALADFDAVLATQSGSAAVKSQQFSARLGKAIVLQKQGKSDEALATLDEVIAQASPADAATMAEAYVRRGESLQASGKEKDALLSYLHVDILFAGEADSHAEALFHLTNLWSTAGKAERSADARRRLTEQYPASEWAKKL